MPGGNHGERGDEGKREGGTTTTTTTSEGCLPLPPSTTIHIPSLLREREDWIAEFCMSFPPPPRFRPSLAPPPRPCHFFFTMKWETRVCIVRALNSRQATYVHVTYYTVCFFFFSNTHVMSCPRGGGRSSCTRSSRIQIRLYPPEHRLDCGSSIRQTECFPASATASGRSSMWGGYTSTKIRQKSASTTILRTTYVRRYICTYILGDTHGSARADFPTHSAARALSRGREIRRRGSPQRHH